LTAAKIGAIADFIAFVVSTSLAHPEFQHLDLQLERFPGLADRETA